MNLKQNLVLASVFIGVLVLGTAITITVSTEEEASQKLGTAVSLEAGDCVVYSVAKTATTVEEISRNYKVKYGLKYTKDGEASREVRLLEAADDSDETIKPLVEKECEKIWVELQAVSEIIDRVIISPDISGLRKQAYSVITKKWRNVATQLGE